MDKGHPKRAQGGMGFQKEMTAKWSTPNLSQGLEGAQESRDRYALLRQPRSCFPSGFLGRVTPGMTDKCQSVGMRLSRPHNENIVYLPIILPTHSVDLKELPDSGGPWQSWPRQDLPTGDGTVLDRKGGRDGDEVDPPELSHSKSKIRRSSFS